MLEILFTPIPPEPTLGIVKVKKEPTAMSVSVTSGGDTMTLHYSDPDSASVKTFNDSSAVQTFTIPANVTEFYLKQGTLDKTLYNITLNGPEITSITWNEGLSVNSMIFYFNPKLIEVSPRLPKDVNSLMYMFNGCTLFNSDISDWDISNVTDMTSMFGSCPNFNQDISRWNTGRVTSMNTMFGDAVKFNQDISNWNVSNVTNMTQVFNRCLAFNQDISRWNTSQVTSMLGMFKSASSFNQNLSGWNVSKVSNRTEFDMGATAWQADFKPRFN